MVHRSEQASPRCINAGDFVQIDLDLFARARRPAPGVCGFSDPGSSEFSGESQSPGFIAFLNCDP